MATVLGAALGGTMADTLGWRWEFGVQIPLLVLLVIVATVTIPKDIGLQGKREGIWTALKAFDFRGSMLLSASTTFLVLGLVSFHLLFRRIRPPFFSSFLLFFFFFSSSSN
jgi:predicted MFS family arabinose efflux permease